MLTLVFGNWTPPPPHNANNFGQYTFVTLICVDTPLPHSLHYVTLECPLMANSLFRNCTKSSVDNLIRDPAGEIQLYAKCFVSSDEGGRY